MTGLHPSHRTVTEAAIAFSSGLGAAAFIAMLRAGHRT